MFVRDKDRMTKVRTQMFVRKSSYANVRMYKVRMDNIRIDKSSSGQKFV